MSEQRTEWVSTDAAGCGVTLRTLYRFIDSGELAAFRMGWVIRDRRTDLDTFIESRRVRPGALRDAG